MVRAARPKPRRAAQLPPAESRADADGLETAGHELNPALPGLTDLIFFAPAEGRIWLDDRRMVLFHSGAFGAMRREIIGAVGIEHGAEALWRIGHVQGQRDAELIAQRWSNEHPMTQRAAGPGLHTLEGFAKVHTVSFERVGSTGAFRAEFIWADSVEADEHVACFGLSADPCCWTLCGYASGFSVAMYGTPVLFREVECRATGAGCCRVIAKPPAEWDAPEQCGNRLLPGSGVARAHTSTVMAPGKELPEMIGSSPSFLMSRRLLARVAPTSATVLLRGESGVGKELFANALHRLSGRRTGPFIPFNCAAIPEGLLESELFGVEKGAFTGANLSRPGRFERAAGGTLFLDEIGLMTPASQAKVLRAIQEREIERVGATRSLRVDVRLVAASNLDLWTEVQAGRFRADLFYRLNVFPIELPPLRERRDDIPALLDYFLSHFVRAHGKKVAGFTQAARRALSMYDYPGNIRELQNLVERGVISVRDGELIDTAHVFRNGENIAKPSFTLGREGRLRRVDTHAALDSTATPASGTGETSVRVSSGLALEEIERQLCRAALLECDGNVAAAARRLGLTRPTLDYRLRRWGLTQPARRDPV